MLEILQYVTSGFMVFMGCTLFVVLGIMSIGWALNALFLGIRGVKCDGIEL